MKKSLFLILTLFLFLVMQAGEVLAAKPGVPGYQLRIAAYQDLKKANEHLQLLKSGGADAYIEKVAIKNKGVWYRVNVGRYAGKADAEAAGRKLKERGVIDVIDAYSFQRTAAEAPASASVPTAVKVAPEKAPVKSVATPEKNPVIKQEEKKPATQPPVKAPAAAPVAEPPKSVPPKPVAVPAKQPSTTSKVAPAAPIVPTGTFLEDAVRAFNAGQHQEALEKFQKIDQAKLDPAAKEKVLRYIADCQYEIGSKGSNRDLLSAVDGYKELLLKYPDSRDENAKSLYNLAKSYVLLKFFYEARREFMKLYTQFPESPHQAEALFMAGEMSYRTRNFNEAIVRYREYLTKFPQGAYVQKAYFGIGGSYSQLQQVDLADSWYVEAQKKWSLEAIPQESVLNMGYHYFRSHKYADSIPVLFFYINTYPDGDESREALFSIARSFVEMQQYSVAIKMLSHLIERYPDSREAQESAVIMANVGVKSPNIKFPDIPGIQNYRNPLKVYNTMLIQSGMGEMTEGLLFQKGYALWKFGRYAESFESFSAMALLFPQGRYKEEGIKNLVLDINQLVEQYGAQGDYLSIARIYFMTPSEILSRNVDLPVSIRIGEALYKVGLLFDAKRFIETLLKNAPAGSDTSFILFALADIENRRGRQEEAERILQMISPKAHLDRNLVTSIQILRGDIFLRKGLNEKAAAAYAAVLSSGEPGNAAELYRNYAFILKESNACDAALVNYDKAVNLYLQAGKGPPYYAEDVLVTSYQGMGECYMRQGKPQEAAAVYKKSILGPANRRQNLWALYDMGKGYVYGNKPAMADQVFNDLKNKSGEEFWGNIIDYTVKEKAWTEKYAKYLRK